MKCILEELQQEYHEHTIISFFFNARGTALEHTIEGCYRSLLHQLLTKIPSLRHKIGVPHHFTEGQSWPVATVRDLFRRAVRLLENQRMILVIDALDEGNEDDIGDMVDLVDGLARSNQQLHTCLASRHYPNITFRHCEELIVDASESHEEDIRFFTLTKLNVRPEAQRAVLVAEIMRKAQGVFLWVVLVARLLNKQYDRGASHAELLASLSVIPENLEDLISTIVSDGASDKYFIPALLWTLASHSDMSIAEIYCGIRLGAGEPCPPVRRNDSASQMVLFVLQASRGLLEAVYDRLRHLSDTSPFHFIHESVRQHILVVGLGILDPTLACNVEPRTHRILADWCLRHVSSWVPADTCLPINVSTGMIDWDLVDEENNQAQRTAIEQSTETLLNFAEYAQDFTFFHLDKAYLGKEINLSCLEDFPIKKWIDMVNIFASRFTRYKHRTSLLHLIPEADSAGVSKSLSDPGLVRGLFEHFATLKSVTVPTDGTTPTRSKLVSELFFGRSWEDERGGRYEALLLAWHGCLTYVGLLLDEGADINAYSREQSALAVACRKNDIEMAIFLLDRGANVNLHTPLGASALAEAMRTESHRLVGLLLSREADVNLRDSDGHNIALQEASFNDDDGEMTRWLLENGALE